MWETSSMANVMRPAFAVVLRMMACRPISTSLEIRGSASTARASSYRLMSHTLRPPGTTT